MNKNRFLYFEMFLFISLSPKHDLHLVTCFVRKRRFLIPFRLVFNPKSVRNISLKNEAKTINMYIL